LITLSSDETRYLRKVLLDVREADAFLWLLRWLKNQKHCEAAIYEEVTRTPSVRQKIEALNAGTRYLGPSQKMSRAKGRRRGAVKRERNVTPSAEE